jgi:general secretion pathway protein J
VNTANASRLSCTLPRYPVCRHGTWRRATHGFTLIELLVALFITAVMFAIGYRELDQALTSRRELDEQSARLMAIQTAVRTIEQDFELLQPRPVRALMGDGYLPVLTSSPTGGNNTLLVGGSSSDSNGPLIPVLSFTRGSWTNPAGLERSELQRVSYALQGDRLVRQYLPVLDGTLQDATITRTLLDHVKSFSLRFMDAGHNWQTQWPEPVAPGLLQPLPRTRPIAVEVTLQLDDWGTIVRHIEVAG